MNLATSEKLPGSVWALALALGIGMSSATIAVRIAAEIGEDLSGIRALATLPTGMQIIGVMLGGMLSSRAMARFGRKPVLQVGLSLGILAGLIGVLAVVLKSYAILFPAHFVLGIFVSNIALLRFTAADQVSGPMSARALSLTLFGGVIAAFIGPNLVVLASGISEIWIYAISYGFISVVSGVAWLVIALTPIKNGPEGTAEPTQAKVDPATYMTYPYIAAVLTGAVGYGVMSLLMTAAALHMKELNGTQMHAGHFSNNVRSFAIMWHVVAMFAPMLILPRIATIVGLKNLMLIGSILLILAAVLGLTGSTPFYMFSSLICLGLGWAACYGAGGILVKQAVPDAARFVAQGRNEFVVSFFAGVGAVGAGPVLASLGWSSMNIAAILVVCILIPVLLFLDRKQTT